MNSENKRMSAADYASNPWRKWGPYLSERQWGTVREDYSDNNNAWDYFTHDQARSRAYKRGEDGIAGYSDDRQLLCFGLALWNGADAIIKERLFGLANSEGNHGEDVKEYYYYLDSTPTHSYMKYLYKYPQRAYPYDSLVATNKRRSRLEGEYELMDTGVFDEDRYYDVFVEYAKAAPDDTLIRITIHNRGPQETTINVLPTLWFRNIWSDAPEIKKPVLTALSTKDGEVGIQAEHRALGSMFLYCQKSDGLLFTENETNTLRLFNTPNAAPFVKDGISNYLLHGEHGAVNPARTGTKAAARYILTIPPGRSTELRLRLTSAAPGALKQPLGDEWNATFALRAREADEFYSDITPKTLSADAALVYRQALSGLLWNKQFYYFDVHKWLCERCADPLSRTGKHMRNKDWFHMLNQHVISMPDKWEYPWYAAWDLAFHAIALSSVDLEFAKNQLEVTLGDKYLHPNGQIPAYEWNFSDVNPPVHAWAAIFLHKTEKKLRHNQGDLDFLARVFSKLLLNFTWWVNRKDREGRNVFEGGFLGLDNIGVFDRSVALPTGGYLEQADGTAWMALFSQCMFGMAVELTRASRNYEDLCLKFADHFLLIAWGMNGSSGMWDEEDGFYYDVLRLPDGSATRLKVRSLVGLLPLCATAVIEAEERERLPHIGQGVEERLAAMPKLAECIHPLGNGHQGVGGRSLSALLDERKLRRMLSRMLDENEFLSPYGIRSMSRFHRQHPYVFRLNRSEYRVDYEPAESTTGAFGGNSNWRGPVWLPANALVIRSLLQFYLYYGDSFLIEFPTGSGNRVTLFEAARLITDRLGKLFLLNGESRRPAFGKHPAFHSPSFRDHVLFYEYFDGDTGAGLGASHQTGWTAIIARLMQLFNNLDPSKYLETGAAAGD